MAYSGDPGQFPPPAAPAVARPLSGEDERAWALGAHLGSFAAAYVALGFLGPLVVLLAAGPRSAYVRAHAVEALNFNLSVLLYVAVCIPLLFILVGIPLLVLIGLVYLVSTVQGGMAAWNGEPYRYPVTIRFVR